MTSQFDSRLSAPIDPPGRMPAPPHRPMSVFAFGTGLIVLATGLGVATAPDLIEACRAAIRATARCSLLCFVMAYTAHALVTLWPTSASRWLLRHRRQWGWLLLVSHGVHALAIAGLGHLDPALLTALSPPAERWGPAIAYAVLLLMGLTSFDRSAAWLTRPAWQHLHTWGSHYLWLSFMIANAKRVPLQPLYLLPVALLCVSMGLRVRARWRLRKGLASSSGRR